MIGGLINFINVKDIDRLKKVTKECDKVNIKFERYKMDKKFY
jgi:hypothetical protein